MISWCRSYPFFIAYIQIKNSKHMETKYGSWLKWIPTENRGRWGTVAVNNCKSKISPLWIFTAKHPMMWLQFYFMLWKTGIKYGQNGNYLCWHHAILSTYFPYTVQSVTWLRHLGMKYFHTWLLMIVMQLYTVFKNITCTTLIYSIMFHFL
jgi:hypothetical protein